MFSRKNAVPTNLESSFGESNTKIQKRGSLALRVILTRKLTRKCQEKPLVLGESGGSQC